MIGRPFVVGDSCGHLWGLFGNRNWAIYPPGDRCIAFPGSPIFPEHWVVVFWWPGERESIALATSEADARERLAELRNGGRL